jgi:UDP-N-acetylmuramate dehydrogenase
MTQLTADQIKTYCSRFPSAKENESMAVHTYLKIGGPARLYLVASSADEIVQAVEKAKELMVPWYVFGGGSNLLVSDDGFQGVVIQTLNRGYTIDGTTVTAEPGVFTGMLAKATAEAGLTGFEWGVGVPGMMGGATYGNAGCFGGEMKDVVTSVEAYDVASGKQVTYTNAECRFGYRDSRFKHEPHIILKTVMDLARGSSVGARSKIDEIMAKRKETQPQGAFTAGCMFKNFGFTDDAALEKLRREGDEIPEAMLSQKRISAGWLIDTLGLKGMTVGKAQVSPVHGNFLVNLGGATAQDVIALSSAVKTKVRDELGILLEDEVQYLGF